MATNIPSPETFDYRNKEQFEAVYENLRSCRAVSRYLARAGRDLSDGAVNGWRVKHGIPVANEAYRLRFDGSTPVETSEVATNPLAQELKRYLKRCTHPRSIEELCDHFSVPPKEIKAAIINLEDKAVLIKVVDDSVSLEEEIMPSNDPTPIDFRKYAETEIAIGLISDPHIGSKYERMDVNEALFDRWYAEGVQTVWCLGNMIDGERKGINEYDIYVHGFEEQCDNLIKKWPRREGMTTHFITGECHEGWYIKQNHINVGRRIEQEAKAQGREDLVFLGHLEHDLLLEQDEGSAKVRLLHPGGGSAYATSYKPQKIVESYQGGEKPNVLLIGHYHKYDTGYPREVYEVQCGTTQDQTPFMRRHNIAAHVGGLTLRMTQNTLGIITTFTVTWQPFYDRTFYEYQW